MPFYEMLPGGMPAGLQSDMDAVLNKKWGTSTTYPPEDWPETVNLMGPLPERTVSGSVVTFSDGADDVPIKSCAVTIAPTLDGVSSVNVVSAGKNLIDISGTDTDNGYTDDRWLSYINTYNNNNDWHITEYLPILPNTDYTLSGIAYGNAPSVCFYDENKDFISGIAYANRSSFTFTSPATAKFVRFSIRYDFTEFMMEYGSTATAYTEYVEPTNHTANLGRTIYGGSVDVVNGTGTDNCKKITLGDFTWIKSGTEGNFYCSQVTDIWYPSEGGISRYGIGVSDEFEFVQGAPADGQINAYFNTAYSGYRIFIKKADYAERTSAEFKEYLQTIGAHLVYKVNDATAETFTFTPVPIISRLGDNTLWADGDLSVTYRRDIDLALAQ